MTNTPDKSEKVPELVERVARIVQAGVEAMSTLEAMCERLRGTMECPVCGLDTPHNHTEGEE